MSRVIMRFLATTTLLIASTLISVPGQAQEAFTQRDATEPAPLVELTEREADRMVRQKMEERERAEAARRLELESARIIERAEADLGDRKVIFNRVVPQARRYVTSRRERPEPPRQLSEAELAQFYAAYEQKDHRSLFLSGTVYEDGVTELSWTHGGRRYEAFANIDFRHFMGVGDFETEDAHYTLLMAIGEGTRESIREQNRRAEVENWSDYNPKWVPGRESFSSDSVEYLVVSEEEITDDSPYACIEAMLAHYANNHEQMKIAYQRAVALREAQERYLRANPPQPQDTIINFAPSPKSKSQRRR